MIYKFLVGSVFGAMLSQMALAESVYTINVQKRGEVIGEGVATQISSADVMTRFSLIDEGDTVFAIDPKTGSKIQLDLIFSDENLDIAVFQSPGLTLIPIVFSQRNVEVGEKLSYVTPEERLTGEVLSITEDSFTHSIDFTAQTVGAPLLNRCGEFSGWNHVLKRGMFASEIEGGNAPVSADYLNKVSDRLNDADIKSFIATKRCLTAFEVVENEARERQAELDRAQEEILAREVILAEQQAEIELVQAELDAARMASDLAQAEAEDAAELLAEREVELQATQIAVVEQEAIIEQTVSELETTADMAEAEAIARENLELEVAEAEYEQQKQFYGSAAAFVLLLIVVWLQIRRSRATLGKLEGAQEKFSDIVLSGSDEGGMPYSVRIDGLTLKQSIDGLIIGKSAGQAQVIIANQHISRAHAKLLVDDGQLNITDLGSTNKTLLNGRELKAGEVATVRDGDELAFAGVIMSVQFTG